MPNVKPRVLVACEESGVVTHELLRGGVRRLVL